MPNLLQAATVYGIICLKDANPKCAIPIVDDDDGMATWSTLREAKAFASGHILCQISEVLYIDLINGTIEY